MKNLAKDAIVTLLVSYVFYVVLESPFIRLLEIIKNKSYPIKLEKECKPENDKTIAGSVGHCDVCNNNYLFTYRSEKWRSRTNNFVASSLRNSGKVHSPSTLR